MTKKMKEKKIILGKQKPRECIIRRLALQEMLK